jgi:hypothetical protein
MIPNAQQRVDRAVPGSMLDQAAKPEIIGIARAAADPPKST